MRPLLVAALLVAWSGSARALDDLAPPRSVAIGGAGIADATGSLGPALNPAGMVLERRIYLDAIYGFDVRTVGSNVYVAVVDSVTNAHVAVGLYYNYVHASPKFTFAGAPTEGKREGNEWGSSVAIPLGDRFAFGVTTKYIRASTEVPNPNASLPMQPPTLTLDTTTQSAAADGFTADVGFVLRLSEAFNFGAVGYNLIPVYSVEAPIGLGLGLSYMFGTQLLISADCKIAFNQYRDPATDDARTTVRVGGGLEYIAANIVPIRAGFVYDSGRPGSFLSLGVGYQGRNFGIDVAYRQQVGNGVESLIIAGIRLSGE